MLLMHKMHPSESVCENLTAIYGMHPAGMIWYAANYIVLNDVNL